MIIVALQILHLPKKFRHNNNNKNKTKMKIQNAFKKKRIKKKM